MRNGLRHALACVEVLRKRTEGRRNSATAKTATSSAGDDRAPRRRRRRRRARLWRYEVDVNARERAGRDVPRMPRGLRAPDPVPEKEKKEEDGRAREKKPRGSSVVAAAVVRFERGSES